MGNIKKLAGYKRVKHVSFTSINEHGEPEDYDLQFRLPTFLEAVEFQKDFKVFADAMQFAATVQRDANLAPPVREETMTDEEYKQIEDAYVERMDNIDPEDAEAIRERVNDLREAQYRFAVKWLPKVCEDFIGLEESEIYNIIRVTTRDGESPLVVALVEIIANVDNAEGDDLHSLPF